MSANLSAECLRYIATSTSLPSQRSDNPKARPSQIEVWLIGFAFVTVISVSAALGIGLMKVLNTRVIDQVLVYMVGLGVGALSGSAVFHLIPETFGIHYEGFDENLQKCWVVVIGIYLFFFVDKVLKVWSLEKEKSSRKIHIAEVERNGKNYNSISETSSSVSNTQQSTATVDPTKKEVEAMHRPASHCVCGGVAAAAALAVTDTNKEQINSVAWMVVFGDGLHNFIDGLSIGAAFTNSITGGVSISLAILCEELPHELGDVAIMLNAGMSSKQALFYNLLSAATCYLGFVIGVLVGEIGHATGYVFALASGMFLFIPLASMVPEMNNMMEEKLKESTTDGLKVLALQSIGVVTGLLAMFLMGIYGDTLEQLFV